jgi:hypothetical protein
MKYKFLIANKRGFLRPLGRIALSLTGISSSMPESKSENRSVIFASKAEPGGSRLLNHSS